jgi:DNA-binding MarR family transcriptional regulator
MNTNAAGVRSRTRQTSRPLTVARPALLHESTDIRFRQFLHAFMVFARRVSSVRDLLAEALDVTGPQYEILSHLRQSSPGAGMTINELARHLHCSGAFVTTEVGKLFKHRLLTKTRDHDDARRLSVRLTERCETRMRSLAPMQSDVNDTLFGALTPDDFATLWRVMPRMAADGDRAVLHASYLLRSRGQSDG